MTAGGRNRKGFLLACSLSGADYKFQRLCHTFSLFRKCLVERCLRGLLSLVQCFLCGHSVNLYLICRYLQGVLDCSVGGVVGVYGSVGRLREGNGCLGILCGHKPDNLHCH